MPVAAHHHQIDSVVGKVIQDRVSHIDLALRYFGERDRQVMPGQMLGNEAALRGGR